MDEILNLIESVSEDFPSYSLFSHTKLTISVNLITLSTCTSLVQQVTGPRITPVKSNRDQFKSNGPSAKIV